MRDPRWRLRPSRLAVLLGAVLFAIGLYGHAQFVSTLVACIPKPTLLDFRITGVTLRHITYTDGCNDMGGPSYAVLWPVGLVVIVLGCAFEIRRSFSRGDIARGVAVLLVCIGLTAGSVSFATSGVLLAGASLLVILAGISILASGWLRGHRRRPA